MVREDQVAAAALDVERHAEVLQRDRGALDVPAGAAVAEGGVPRGLARALGLPEQAVERVLLAGAVGSPPRSAKTASICSRSQPATDAEPRV